MLQGIVPVFGGGGNGVVLNLTTDSDVLKAGTVVYRDTSGDIVTANASTTSATKVYVCPTAADYATRVNKTVDVTDPKGISNTVFRCRTDGSFTKNNIGLQCGLNATGDAINKTNTSNKLVEITDVISVPNGQEAYFKFI